MAHAVIILLLLLIGAMAFIAMVCSVYVATRLRQLERRREAEGRKL